MLQLTAFVAFLAAVGSGCHQTASDGEHRVELATIERCGPGFEGQMLPRSEVLKRETAQAEECKHDKCYDRALGMMRGLRLRVFSCDNARRNIERRPILDAWGARDRVICNGASVQAISAGYDGKIGTCDDIAGTIAVNPGSLVHPATRETCGGRFNGQTISGGEIVQHETAQTVACPGDECNGLVGRYMFGVTCDEVRASVDDRPILDAWGAQVRVVCRAGVDRLRQPINEAEAEAISAGYDGKLGTCDDVATRIAIPEEWIVN